VDDAAKLIREALGIETDEVANYYFRNGGRVIANSVPASSANG
jgi:hypothetical protein